MLIVFELTFDVKIVFKSLVTRTMWVRSWPVPSTQSSLLVAGSYRPIAMRPSAVK